MEANTPPEFTLKTDRDDLDLPAEQVVVAYHERTKHHYHRYAASLGYLDWAKQQTGHFTCLENRTFLLANDTDGLFEC